MRHVRRLVLICAIVALLAPYAGSADKAVEISERVKFKVSTGSVGGATDGLMTTAWAPKGDGAMLYMEFPADGADYVCVDWDSNSRGYEFIQYGADKTELSSCTDEDSYPAIIHLFPVADGARYAVLKLAESGQKICRVRVYSRGELSDDVPDFDAPCEKCDLMVIAAHQDDEFLCFGGIIPYYTAVRNKKIEVVYMTDCGRLRRGEALDGLWMAGVKNYPDFIGLKDKRVATIKEGVELWGGKDSIVSKLVRRIRRYRPEVVLTHDLDGEDGHNQHKITANAVKLAVIAAADPAQYPDSYAEYGAWQVKKLYLHLYSEDVIDFDWNAVCEALDGKTPLELAKACYARHASQQAYDQLEDGGECDNSLFGLAYSAVGEDALHDDLFENIDAAATPAPTAESTAEPALFFSPEPEPSATAAPQINAEIGPNALRAALFVGGGIALLALLSGIQAVSYARRRGRKK